MIKKKSQGSYPSQQLGATTLRPLATSPPCYLMCSDRAKEPLQQAPIHTRSHAKVSLANWLHPSNITNRRTLYRPLQFMCWCAKTYRVNVLIRLHAKIPHHKTLSFSHPTKLSKNIYWNANGRKSETDFQIYHKFTTSSLINCAQFCLFKFFFILILQWCIQH